LRKTSFSSSRPSFCKGRTLIQIGGKSGGHVNLDGEELEVILAQNDETIYFTKTHLADLKKVIEVDRRSITGIPQADGET
ncbi:hypothetical protein, partial [Croceicoccus naphthovorans]|uniref:hypothetical protein n=1 Tax=Croceicoccus naphthovorans TaxID=1348774 RepID=UPI001C87D87B